MRIRRRVSDFLIKGCGLRKLHGARPSKFIREVLDEIDLQYIRDTQPCPAFSDRGMFFQHVQESCVKDQPVDYLEFGVYRGESISKWSSLNRHPDSRFFGFDSFEGLPEHWRPGQAKGHFDVGGAVPMIDDGRVTFVKGWFDATIPPFVQSFKAQHRLVIHVDADLYSSAMLVLLYFGPFMSKGTLIIFDEFYDRDNEFKALMDWQRISKRNYRIVAQMENYGKICAELL